MIHSDLPPVAGSTPGLAIGQRVRVTCGPLRNLRGVVESLANGRVRVNAAEHAAGLCVCLPPTMLERLTTAE